MHFLILIKYLVVAAGRFNFNFWLLLLPSSLVLFAVQLLFC